MPCAQKRLQSSTEGVVYPLQPDQREFFCIVKKVNDARNHVSAAAHLLRDAGYVAQWAARSQQAALPLAGSVSARRRSPVSAADPTARGVAASRARVKKKRTKLSFFPNT